MQCVEENKNTISERCILFFPVYTNLGNGIPYLNLHISHTYKMRTQLVKRKFIFLKSLPLTKYVQGKVQNSDSLSQRRTK